MPTGRASLYVGIAVVAAATSDVREAVAWTSEENLTPGFVDSLGRPRVRAGPSGRIHCIHHSEPDTSNRPHLYYRFWNGSTWSGAQDLPGPNHKEPESDMVVGADEHVHVVGTYRTDGTTNTPYAVYYWEYDGNAWSGPVQLSAGTGGDSSSCLAPSIAIDRNGDLHVVWEQKGATGGGADIMYRKRQAGAWQPIRNVTANPPGTSYGSEAPDIAADRIGNTVHIVWHDDFLNNGFQAYYTKNTNLGDPDAWIPSSQWFQLSTGSYGKSPRIVLDRNDRPNVWWLDRFGGETNVMGYRRWTGSNWTAAANWGLISVQDGQFDAANVLHYVYVDVAGSSGWELYYRTWDYVNFSATELVSTGPDTMKVDYAGMTLDLCSVPHALWEERKGGPAYVYHSRRSVCSGPTGRVKGVVLDQFGAGVAGATVWSAGGQSAMTGTGGAYALQVPVGTWQVTASKAYYLGQTVPDVVVNEGQTTNVNFVITMQPPGPVTNLVITPQDRANKLSWTNPAGGYTGAVIRVRTDVFPASPTDGTMVTDRTGAPGGTSQYTHSGLVGGRTYYYSAFAYFQDASRLYAGSAAMAAGTPLAQVDFDADGDVDLSDFSLFQLCFNGPNRPAALPHDCLAPDADADGDVDLGDFGILQDCFNGPNRPPACE